jgi:hypothetical protein
MEQLTQNQLEAISIERISYLVTQKGINSTIAHIDLEMVKMKIMDPEEGLGWTREDCDRAEIEYKRFLQLNKMFPNESIVPNKTMDAVWHQHILDTRAYHKDCDAVFGKYFHHFPYFGMRSETDKQDLISSFDQTQVIYFNVFDEAMNGEDSSKCNSSCNSSGKCSSRDR